MLTIAPMTQSYRHPAQRLVGNKCTRCGHPAQRLVDAEISGDCLE